MSTTAANQSRDCESKKNINTNFLLFKNKKESKKIKTLITHLQKLTIKSH